MLCDSQNFKTRTIVILLDPSSKEGSTSSNVIIISQLSKRWIYAAKHGDKKSS